MRTLARPVHVRDLPERPPPGVCLHCRRCLNDYSATRGDYFTMAPDEVMACCDRPLVLLQRQTVYRPVPWLAGG